MPESRIISADTHVIEPPDMFVTGVEPSFRDRAPYVERKKTPGGAEYDVWMLEGTEVNRLAGTNIGKRYDNPSLNAGLGVFEEVRKGAYDPHEMIKDLEMDGVWGACIYPTQGGAWYTVMDSELLSACCRAWNDWIADYCRAYPDRLKPIGMLNVDNVDDACHELERCARLGLAGTLIPVFPLPERPYSDPIYERLWSTAQDVNVPLLLHIATYRPGMGGMSTDFSNITPSDRSTTDHWVRYSLTAIIFAGAFERHPNLIVGSVEHEASWVPYWLKQMDLIYEERPAITKGWKSSEGLQPTDYWHRNMFVAFMEDDLGVRFRDLIGVENLLWGNDFPHGESTWPKSMEFLDKFLTDVPEQDRRKITSENAAKLFKFTA